MYDDEFEAIRQEQALRLREITVLPAREKWETGQHRLRVNDNGNIQELQMNAQELLAASILMRSYVEGVANTTATAAYAMTSRHSHCRECAEIAEQACLQARLTNAESVEIGRMDPGHAGWAERL